MIEHADSAAARLGVAIEGEVHLFDAVPFGRRAEFRLRAGGGAAEKNEVGLVHDVVRIQESGDRRQETGDRTQETGDRRQDTGDRTQV
jgi:hypothetical protein